MIIEGQYRLKAPRQAIWNALTDPNILARVIPGCERLTAAGPNRYDAVIKAGVASIKGTYTGTVTIEDAHPPESYALRVEGKGTGGFVRGHAKIDLTDEGEQTAVAVTGDAQIGGLIASVGGRFLGGASKMMLGEFFKALEAEVSKQSG